eukprot:2775081-Pleurochrysis_carterae.AAC.1
MVVTAVAAVAVAAATALPIAAQLCVVMSVISARIAFQNQRMHRRGLLRTRTTHMARIKDGAPTTDPAV